MAMPQQAGGVEVPTGGGAPTSPPLSPASAAAAALANARWNPTKDQVALLEGLYEHGLRTPTAEQIKQIAARLREHGHVEAKNVFYWFQNHKARQRQKQKQDTFAYFTGLLRRPPPLNLLFRPPAGGPPPPYPHHGRLPVPSPPPAAACSNNNNNADRHGVMYRPQFYMPAPQGHPANNPAYYHHLQQQQMPAMYPRMEVTSMISAAVQQHQHPGGAMYHQYQATAPGNASSTPLDVDELPSPAAAAGPTRQTLQLFPMQPTFLLPSDHKGFAAAAAVSPASMASASFSEESEGSGSPESDVEAPALPYYDFFGLQSGGR
nr:unnamed protein product [Digitaria exilis]